MFKLFFLIGLNISIGLFLSSNKGNESGFYLINLSDKSPGNTSPVRIQGDSEWYAAFSFTQIQQDCVKNELIRTDKGMRNLYNNSDLYSFYSRAKRFNGNKDEIFSFCKEYFGKCELEEIEQQFCQLFPILSDANKFDPREEIKKQCKDEGNFCSCPKSDSTSMISVNCLQRCQNLYT